MESLSLNKFNYSCWSNFGPRVKIRANQKQMKTLSIKQFQNKITTNKHGNLVGLFKLVL